MEERTKWFNEKWWISPLNYVNEVRNSFNLPQRVYMRDSTIREGEETSGVCYTLDQKILIAEKLEKIGFERTYCEYID